MAKKQSAMAAIAASAVESVAPEAVAPVTSPAKSLAVARATNGANTYVAPDADKVERAVLVRPSKGENPKRGRVYGYDNLSDGGKVPVDSIVKLTGATGSLAGFDKLRDTVEGHGEPLTVRDCKNAGISSKTIRRAYRSGLIRFAK